MNKLAVNQILHSECTKAYMLGKRLASIQFMEKNALPRDIIRNTATKNQSQTSATSGSKSKPDHNRKPRYTPPIQSGSYGGVIQGRRYNPGQIPTSAKAGYTPRDYKYTMPGKPGYEFENTNNLKNRPQLASLRR